MFHPALTDGDDRGQAHTLEAFVAAILLVAGLTFALQATAVTPLSASTSNQHIENQHRAVATDLLETSAVNGDLREAVLYWDPENETFAGTPEGSAFYTQGGPPTAFGDALNRTFIESRIAVNVYVRYHLDGSQASDRMVFMGTPSDNAVTASRTISVSDDTNLTAPGSENVTLSDVDPAEADEGDPRFYAPDAADGPTYNELEVRIVAWRM